MDNIVRCSAALRRLRLTADAQRLRLKPAASTTPQSNTTTAPSAIQRGWSYRTGKLLFEIETNGTLPSKVRPIRMFADISTGAQPSDLDAELVLRNQPAVTTEA